MVSKKVCVFCHIDSLPGAFRLTFGDKLGKYFLLRECIDRPDELQRMFFPQIERVRAANDAKEDQRVTKR